MEGGRKEVSKRIPSEGDGQYSKIANEEYSLEIPSVDKNEIDNILVTDDDIDEASATPSDSEKCHLVFGLKSPNDLSKEHRVQFADESVLSTSLLTTTLKERSSSIGRTVHPLGDMNSGAMSKLRRMISEKSISRTEELVEIVNTSSEKEKDDLVTAVVVAYAKELGSKRMKAWSLKELHDYMSLTEIHAITESAKLAFRDVWFAKLVDMTKEKFGDERLLRALNVGLLSLDVDVFDGDSTHLIGLAKILLEKLNLSDDNNRVGSTSKHSDILCAIFRICQFLKWLESNHDGVGKHEDVLQKLETRINEIGEIATDDFRLSHQLKQLQESLMDLKSEAGKKPNRCASKITKIARSMPYWSVSRWTVLTEISPSSIEEVVEEFHVAVVNGHQPSCFQWLRSLDFIAHFIVEDERHLGRYLECVNVMKDNEEALMPSVEDRKHFRYGIVEQLMTLNLSGSPSVRDQITERFDALTSSTGTDDVVAEDPDIQKIKHEYKALIDEQAAIEQGANPDQPLSLDPEPQSLSDVRSQTLFSRVKESLDEAPDDLDIGKEEDFSEMMMAKMKDGYRSKYVQVESSGLKGADVSSLQVNLKRIENKNEILDPHHSVRMGSSMERALVPSEDKTEISLDDLFPTEKEVKNVLVIGMPGVGKTLLSKRLVVDWSDGIWGRQFRTVFLVSVPTLNEEKQDSIVIRTAPSLNVAIIDNCFPTPDKKLYVDDLMRIVDEKLQLETTLLILDGMDEAKRDVSGFSEAILNQAMLGGKYNHKLLMLSRPDDIERKIEISDAVIELEGLKDEDMTEYLSAEDSIVRSRMQHYPSIWGLAHNPRNFHILLSMMRSREDDNVQEANSRSLSGLYQDLSTQLWQSYPLGSLDGYGIDIDEAFDDLGKLALIGVTHNRCCLHLHELDDDISDRRKHSVLVESGFLLYNQNGDLEFTHSGLMLSFAGNRLVEMLLKNREEKQVKRYIQKLKYGTKMSEAMAVMAGELGREKAGDDIRELLTEIDGEDTEQPGLQHLGIKMECFQQWILESHPQNMASIDRKFHISSELIRWLKVGLRDVQKDSPLSDTVLKEIARFVRNCPDVAFHCKGQLLRHVFGELKARDWKVHQTVMEVLGSIIELDPEDAMWLSTLQQTQRHSSQTVRQAFMQSLPFLGRFSKRSIPHLLEALNSGNMTMGGKVYCSSLVELLRLAPECADDHVESLKILCGAVDYWTRLKIVQGMPEILKDRPHLVDRLVAFLMEDDVAVSTKLTPVAIELLGICLETCPLYTADIVRHLVEAWRKLGDDERRVTAQTFVKAIHVEAHMIFEIVEDLLTEKEELQWPMSYSMLRIVMSSLGKTSDDDEKVAALMRTKRNEKKDDLHVLALILDVMKNATQLSTNSLNGLIPALLTAFDHPEWSVRSLAFAVTGAIANHHRDQLSTVLIEAVVRACEMEKVWKARCAVFESAEELVKFGVLHDRLLEICQSALGDADDEIRKRAGHVLRSAAVRQTNLRKSLIARLSEGYWKANDDTKHGVVYCLHSLLQDSTEEVPQMMSIFIDAAKNPSPMMCSVGVNALLDVVEVPEIDPSEYIEVLRGTCQRENGSVRFSALDALGKCARRNPEYLTSLIEILKTNLVPRNVMEWEIYLPLLEQAVEQPRSENLELLKTLLKEPTDALASVREAQRLIMNRMTVSHLLQWYDLIQDNILVQPIFRKFHQVPVILKKKDNDQSKMVEVYVGGELTMTIMEGTFIKLRKMLFRRSYTILDRFSDWITQKAMRLFPSLS